MVGYRVGALPGPGTYTCTVPGWGGIHTWRTAYPRPAWGSIGCGLLRAWGSSPKGTDSREPLVPGGTTTKGPLGFGRMTNTGVCGFGLLNPGGLTCAAAGLSAPSASRSPMATPRIRMGRVYPTGDVRPQ